MVLDGCSQEGHGCICLPAPIQLSAQGSHAFWHLQTLGQGQPAPTMFLLTYCRWANETDAWPLANETMSQSWAQGTVQHGENSVYQAFALVPTS